MKNDKHMTRQQLIAALGERAPHHPAKSWGSFWQSHHDLPDKVFAYYRDALSSEEEDVDSDHNSDSGSSLTSSSSSVVSLRSHSEESDDNDAPKKKLVPGSIQRVRRKGKVKRDASTLR